MKEKIDYREVLKETVEALENGLVLLVSVDKKGKPNPMAIGWGAMGEIWGKPVFIVLVRPSRYTYSLIEQTEDFSVNVADESMKDIVIYCGTVSGRNHDKFK
ncbi:MAG TPA: flavin reductase [bacterium]|nr:flavin reductase [bacterium]HOM26872.1 flavin reductase [bacterium]